MNKTEAPQVVTITLNGNAVNVPANVTIMEALDSIGIHIPRLCRMESPCKPTGKCRICLIEVNEKLASACTQTVASGQKIVTDSEAVLNARKETLSFSFAAHNADCQTCELHGQCELLKLAREIGFVGPKLPAESRTDRTETVFEGFIRDDNRCILCGRCVQVCNEIQTIGALYTLGRGPETRIAIDMKKCVRCGQCIHVCPVSALRDNPAWVERTREAIRNPKKHVILQIAPAVRVALGEEFGLPPGTNVIGKLYTASRMLGFDSIGDTNFTADLTILEEGTELITRITNGGVLPQITSCCPGWIKFLENDYPDLIPHVSTCKSPQQMFGALAKTYYAKQKNIHPEDMVVVSIMPCVAKHFEASRPEMNASGYQDVDFVLTTREFARMIRESGINLSALPESTADSFLGEYTGAATIFGTTGGVMEAALRTAYEVLTGQTLEALDFHSLRTLEGIKEAGVQINELFVRVAVAHGLGNARMLLDQLRRGESPYHFIEIMTCPGGCIGGGGQPKSFVMEKREQRALGLFAEDKNLPRRKSHENEEVKRLYRDFLGSPNSQRAHELLHTRYGNKESVNH